MIFLEIIFLGHIFSKALVLKWQIESVNQNLTIKTCKKCFEIEMTHAQPTHVTLVYTKRYFQEVLKNLLFVHSKENIHRPKSRSQMWNVHFQTWLFYQLIGNPNRYRGNHFFSSKNHVFALRTNKRGLNSKFKIKNLNKNNQTTNFYQFHWLPSWRMVSAKTIYFWALPKFKIEKQLIKNKIFTFLLHY